MFVLDNFLLASTMFVSKAGDYTASPTCKHQTNLKMEHYRSKHSSLFCKSIEGKENSFIDLQPVVNVKFFYSLQMWEKSKLVRLSLMSFFRLVKYLWVSKSLHNPPYSLKLNNTQKINFDKYSSFFCSVPVTKKKVLFFYLQSIFLNLFPCRWCNRKIYTRACPW